MPLDICMCGIDHDSASQECRDVFLLDRKACQACAIKIRRKMNAKGCVVLSTCNRTEVWVQGGQGNSPYRNLCNALSIPSQKYESYFYHLQGDGLVRYLFELACGMKSALFGEDQIISQLTQALTWARTVGCPGPVLEHLFRDAVTVAKRVKTAVRLSEADEAVAEQVATLIADRFGALDGVSVLVIGTGEMARLVGRALYEAGSHVIMTIRDLSKATALIPLGCKPVDYDQRFDHVPESDVVISATAGLYYTLDYASVLDLRRYPSLFIDLAMPCDIDPAIARLPDTSLVTLRNLSCDRPRREAAIKEAKVFIDSQVSQFFQWHGSRSSVAHIQKLASDASSDTLWRLQGPLEELGLDDGQFQRICLAIEDSSRKAFAHQLYEYQKQASTPVAPHNEDPS